MKILIQNDMQFSDLLREIPCISARMLTVRLKELEDVGLVERTVSATMPVRVHYSLTGKGRGLTSVLDGIASWAHEWSPVGSVDAVSESADAED